MGAWAALKARTVVDYAAHVVAIELVCACQGIELPPAAAHDARARGRRSPRSRERVAARSSRTARSRPRSSRSPARCAAASSCSRAASAAWLLGSGAGFRSAREKPCVLLREDGHALLLDARHRPAQAASPSPSCSTACARSGSRSRTSTSITSRAGLRARAPARADDLGSGQLALRAASAEIARTAAHARRSRPRTRRARRGPASSGPGRRPSAASGDDARAAAALGADRGLRVEDDSR